jgi:hypothetical protein
MKEKPGWARKRMKITPTSPSPVEGEGELGYFRPDSVSTSAPKGAATEDESVCWPGLLANAINIRVVRLGDDTEKPWGYQEKLPCLRERNEGMEKTSEPRSGFVL